MLSFWTSYYFFKLTHYYASCYIIRFV